jgi:hypothetical protein
MLPGAVTLSYSANAQDARKAAGLVGDLGMTGRSLTAADLAVQRAPDTASGFHMPAGALGRLVTRVCAITFAVVARHICQRL